MTTSTTTIFFHDMSGSTQGRQKYHELSLKNYNEQVKNKNHIIVGWDNEYKVFDDNTYSPSKKKLYSKYSFFILFYFIYNQ